MADPKIPGRMLRRSIATDRGVARLTAEQTAIFCMILPHLDSYGKLIGEPAYIKEVALPFASWATLEVIESALKAINKLTSVKLFRHRDGRRYLHAVQFERHQQLEKNKRGMDLLPSYPSRKSATKSEDSRARSGSGIKEEEKEEFKGKMKCEGETAARPLAFEGQAAASTTTDGNRGNGKVASKGNPIPPIPAGWIAQAPRELKDRAELLYINRDADGMANLLTGKMPEVIVSLLIEHIRRAGVTP
jgi:hypothetical protein